VQSSRIDFAAGHARYGVPHRLAVRVGATLYPTFPPSLPWSSHPRVGKLRFRAQVFLSSSVVNQHEQPCCEVDFALSKSSLQ
jgi:hypothetical protein